MRSRDRNDAHFHLRRRLLLGLAASPLLSALPGRALAQTGAGALAVTDTEVTIGILFLLAGGTGLIAVLMVFPQASELVSRTARRCSKVTIAMITMNTTDSAAA